MQNIKEHNDNLNLSAKAVLKDSKNSENISTILEGLEDSKYIEEYNKLPELRSEAINEVLNNPPAWLVRWGITIMLFLLCIFLLITWFIRYPDLIGGNIKIVSINSPKSVTTKTDGKLIKLFTNNQSFVKQGEILGIMESSADYKEVMALEKIINELINYSVRLEYGKIKAFKMPYFYQLGELQNTYRNLQINNINTENKNSLIQSVNSLKNDIEGWKQKYILYAPATGKVAFNSNLQENQTYRNLQDLFYILPKNEGIYGEMFLGQFNLGKVRIGADVIVKINSYPFEQFGTINGKVESISELPVDSLYLVRISFPKGLKTNINRNIPFKNGMSAQGQIITSDLRLAERFFYEVKKVIHNNE
jgi:hypothetical protein